MKSGQNPTPRRIALGMSGGVDSSLAAYLLRQAGHHVTGVYLECWRSPGCRSEEDRKDALAVALSLGIPFQVLDFKEAYRQRVVETFFTEYAAGRTPNPDVWCNKEIKFGLFYDWAMAHGFDAVATGHYAQIRPVSTMTAKEVDAAAVSDSNHTRSSLRLALHTSADPWKDQTYFLYRLTAAQLPHTIFPIGHLTKAAVRQQAAAAGLATAAKKDSVGICFIGDINVHQFLKDRLGEQPGEVVDRQGRVIGRHQGLWFYTIGQRHGFTVFPKTVEVTSQGEQIDHHHLPPFYVIAKRPAENQLVVGFGRETYQSRFRIAAPHWIDPGLLATAPATSVSLLVRIRHTGQLLPAHVDLARQLVTLETAVQGIAAGQSAVFYRPSSDLHQTQLCLGGAVIEESYFDV